jgi:signal transduction histidine kinase
MNNPLTVISGQAQILLRQADSMRERASATAVIEAAHTLSELIADLHFFARPPAPALQSSSVSDVVSGAIARAVRLGVERGGVDESSDSAIVPEIPVDIGSVLMDPDQIGLAVTEVVLNAIQAEPKGSVSVRVHRDAAERRLVIAVEDDGAGMSEHTLSHAFDPFFSARPAGRRSGLGLARARRLVELHGGTIRIRSEAGVGTEVWIALPTDGACVDATERSAA